MKNKIQEEMLIPEGVSCDYKDKKLTCSKGHLSLERELNLPGINVSVKDGKILFSTDKGAKNEMKYIKSSIAHIKNLFLGLEKKFVYRLETCNVHFPMTLKVEGSKLMINNFLGEKVSRAAKILPSVEIEVKGNKITLSSNYLEVAGETATNIEKATRIKKRDRRVFQDGIFIVEKPGDIK